MTKHVSDLKFDDTNPRRHNPRNLQVTVDSLQKVGFARSIVIDEDDNILAGNGVIEAATITGIENVVEVEADGSTIIAVRRRGLTDEQKRLLKYYDNRSSELADWDPEQILADIEDGMNFSDMFREEELAELLGELEDISNEDDNYVRSIESPEYTLTGEKPDVSQLWDSSRTDSLIEEIEASNIPELEKEFLRRAAQRHTVFNFKHIAEYYAHSNEEVQTLMENNALVIIDFNKAISLGFVQLTKEIAEMVRDEYGD